MAEATPDPTLATLVPQPSTTRNVLLVLVAAALLAGAWFVAPLVRPALIVSGGGPGMASDPLPISLAFITAAGPLTVEAVGDTGSAAVAGAWLVPGAHGSPDPDDAFVGAASPEDFLRTLDIDPDDAALPQTLGDGEDAWLVVAWRLTDCAGTGDVDWGTVTVRSPLGVERQQEIVGAGQAIMVDEALRTATCR